MVSKQRKERMSMSHSTLQHAKSQPSDGRGRGKGKQKVTERRVAGRAGVTHSDPTSV